MNTVSRTEFIKEFVALVRFIAAGEANIGFLGKERMEIHRAESASITPEDLQRNEDEICPPQEEFEKAEEESWRKEHAAEYGN